MAAPTAIEVSVDSDEYSRYEESRSTITASVTISGGAPYASEPIVVELIKARRDRDAVVATSTLEFTTYEDPTIGEVTFYLPDVVDQDLISLVRHGRYFVKATHEDSSLSAESGDFDIRVITVEEFKSKYLFGLDLQATNILLPKFQPTSISSVRITELSGNHPEGFHVLTYNYNEEDSADATADIGTGSNGTVTVTAEGDHTGEAGNSLAVEVVTPSGTSGLSASFASNLLTVNLSVSGGTPVGVDNTATLVAAAIDALPEFAAAASGTGADSLSSPEGPTSFAGGVTDKTRYLSWDGGSSVSITSTGTYILRKGDTNPVTKLKRLSSHSDYICVRVSSLLGLPSSTVAEEILIEQAKMDDSTLGTFLDQAIAWLEEDELDVYIEPTNVVTDRDPTTVQYAAGIQSPAPLFTDTDYDFIKTPLTYFYPPAGHDSWIFIQTPYNSILRVDNLFGAIANTRVIDIDLEWIEHSTEGGVIQLVPFNQEIAFDFVGLIWVNSIRGAVELPNFWHYNMIVGLREARSDIREVIAKKAAIDALTVASQAFRPGIGSVSLGRDGVSESVSYTAQAQFGLYTGQISQYKDQLEKQLPKLKGRYRGINFRVV